MIKKDERVQQNRVIGEQINHVMTFMQDLHVVCKCMEEACIDPTSDVYLI